MFPTFQDESSPFQCDSIAFKDWNSVEVFGSGSPSRTESLKARNKTDATTAFGAWCSRGPLQEDANVRRRRGYITLLSDAGQSPRCVTSGP